MADLLALVCGVYCDFVTFPFYILGQVWYLIEPNLDPCCLSNFSYGSLIIYRIILDECLCFIVLIKRVGEKR